MAVTVCLFFLGACSSSLENVKAGEPNEIIKDKKVTLMDSSDLNIDSGIQVRDQGDRIQVVINNPLVTPRGITKWSDLKKAVKVKAASGILHAAGKYEIFAVAEVKNGKSVFSLLNYGKASNDPVIEHLWFYAEASDGSNGYVVMDPKDPWISYETKSDGSPNLETLAVGLVMYPDKPTVPLKSLGKGKLKQSQYPELK